MGRDRHYVHGDFYRVDDRTGFPERAEKTRKEWTGLIVHRDRWERRPEQDFVKGVLDDQTVPDPRPLPPDIFVGPLSVTLTARVSAGGQVLLVTSTTGMGVGDTIEVMLDTGVFFSTTIKIVYGPGLIVLTTGLPYSAAAGNIVTDPSPSGALPAFPYLIFYSPKNSFYTGWL